MLNSPAQSHRRQTKIAPNGSNLTDIQKVDFKNFTYQIDFGNGSRSIRLRHRDWRARNPLTSGFVNFVEVVYGDLTSDGSDNAVVMLIISGGGTGYWKRGYILTLQNKQVSKLTEFEGGGKILGEIQGMKVENGFLRVESFDRNKCDECYYIIKYRLDGNRLTEISRPGMKRKNLEAKVECVFVTRGRCCINSESV